MKNDLSLKVGDKAWSALRGEVIISDIKLNNAYPIQCSAGMTYNSDGRSVNTHPHPTLFASLDAMIAYWQGVKDEQSLVSGKEAFAAFKEGKTVHTNGGLWFSNQYCTLEDAMLLISASDSNEKIWRVKQ